MNKIACLFGSVALATMLTTAANATEVTGACRGDNVAADALYGADISTTSTAAVPTGLSVAIDMKGEVADCILVSFSGSVKTSPGASIVVRAVFDGNNVIPGAIRLASDQHTAYETGTAIFIARNIPKGPHTVEVQWRTTGGLVYMRSRSLTTVYKGQ